MTDLITIYCDRCGKRISEANPPRPPVRTLCAECAEIERRQTR